MDTSFVKYKEFGFWSRDTFLESWLGTLLNEMQELPARETWLESAKEHRQAESTIDGGVMSLNLDKFLINDERRDRVLSLALMPCGEVRERRVAQVNFSSRF